MTAKIVAFVSFFTLSIFAFAQTGASQVANLEEALRALRSISQLPALKAHPNTSVTVSNDVILDEAKETFSRVQKFVYGKDNLITLRACNGCQAIADANTMSVYLDPKFLNTLKSRFGTDSKNIIAFIVAHEISHFTYEYIAVSAANKLSPNGNIPLLTKSFIDFVDLNKFTTMTPEEQQAETVKYLAMAGRAHAEVDLLGLLTLKGMNIQISADAIKYLKEEVTSRTPQERGQTDFELRLKTVTEAAANGDL